MGCTLYRKHLVSLKCKMSMFQVLLRALLLVAMSLAVGSSQEPNKCDTAVQSLKDKVTVSWLINVGLLTPDSFKEICFGKVSKGMPSTMLCWNKVTNTFTFSNCSGSLSSWCKTNVKKPRAKKHPDGSVTVSVEISMRDNFGQLLYWEIVWAGIHNRVIDEMLYCTYRVESIDCGKRPHHFRNIWSANARRGAWPWQVSIKHRYREHLCGGSVIGPRWILTAAHCFDDLNPADFTIIAGEHHLYIEDGFEQKVSIENLFKHPRYNKTCRYNNDVALLKLDRTIKYNKRVGPVCLPDSEFASGSICHITGWGTNGNSGKRRPKTLKQSKLPLVPRDTCKKRYSDLRSSGYCITRHMRCAGYVRKGVDACRGDSGGPLVCHRNRKWYLMGVASWGARCGLTGRYGVYADVLRLKRWIQETIQDS